MRKAKNTMTITPRGTPWLMPISAEKLSPDVGAGLLLGADVDDGDIGSVFVEVVVAPLAALVLVMEEKDVLEALELLDLVVVTTVGVDPAISV